MKSGFVITGALLFTFGIAVGYAAPRSDPSLYEGKTKEEAARALLDLARVQAGKGSWERIAVGRLYYLGGFKPEGKAIFDEVLAKKPAGSDLLRIARVYRQADEWDKAKPLLDRYVQENPKDEKGLAEAGAGYLQNGDRATAEALFARSFARESELWATVAIAGAYLGVPPQE